MKPASIISLIVAVVIIIAGVITCVVAENMAEKSGESIFSEIKTADNNIQVSDFTDISISKIQLVFNDADVTIIGGSDKSYVEFVNFRNNYYSLAETSSMISFDETPDLVSMLTFWESGFSFKGIRYILNLTRDNTDHDAKKEIRIHLADTSTVKQIEIQATDCTVNISNVKTDTDYLITASNVVINTSNIMTSSAVNINTGKEISPAKSVKFTSDMDYITNLYITADNLDFTANSFMSSGSATIVFSEGKANLNAGGNMQFSLASENGNITVNSTPVSKSCTVGTSGANIKITSESGDINVNTGALSSGTYNYN